MNTQELYTAFNRLVDSSNIATNIYPGVVWDNNDPAMLGRIRVVPVTSSEKPDYNSYIKKISPDFNELTDPWTKNDPALFLPLLPYFISQVPEKGEYVHIFYYNTRIPTRNKFFIQGPLSDPRRAKLDLYDSSTTYMSMGLSERTKENGFIKSRQNGVVGEVQGNSVGIFPEPGDNAFLGRGSADLIVKPNEVLLRAGKFKQINDVSFPVGNQLRSFLQLSMFDSRIVEDAPVNKSNLKEVVKIVKKMIVWHVENLENNSNKFNGYIAVYNVIANSDLVNTKNFRPDTITKLSIGTNYSGPIQNFTFNLYSIDEISILANKVIKGLFDGVLQISETNVNQENFKDGLPFVVTPSKSTYEKGNLLRIPTTEIEVSNALNYSLIYNKIYLDANKFEKGYFLVSGKDGNNTKAVYGAPSELETKTIKTFNSVNSPVSYSILGGQKVYLLSQDSTDGPKGVINLSNTLYGIPQERFLNASNPKDSIEAKTYSTVRGDELVKLLRKLVEYIRGHVHPISTMPPIPVTGTQSIDEIDQLLANAEKTILNENIRIN